MKITPDGNMFLVTPDSFVDLQESDAYFFITQEEYESFLREILKVYKDSLVELVDNAIAIKSPSQGEKGEGV